MIKIAPDCWIDCNAVEHIETESAKVKLHFTAHTVVAECQNWGGADKFARQLVDFINSDSPASSYQVPSTE